MDHEILLWCSIIGHHVGRVFPVEILPSKSVGQLKDAIKKTTEPSLNHIDAYRLDIYMLPNPLLQDDILTTLGSIVHGVDIPDAVELDPMKLLSNYFPTPPVPKRLHLVIQEPDKPLAKDLETDQQIMRSQAIKSANKREAPSTAAKTWKQMDIQSSDQPDAVHNWRPINLCPPPISIYHPVFAQFTRELSVDPNSVSFTESEYSDAMDVMGILLEFYSSEEEKQKIIGNTSLFLEEGRNLLRVTGFMRDGGDFIEPSGHRLSHVPALNVRIPSEIIEVKNEMGDGGADGLAQAERDYVWLHTSDEYSAIRNISPCPAFLIGIHGSWIHVSGAVFAESFYSEGLVAVSMRPQGGESRQHAIRRVACLVKAIWNARKTLDGYYARLGEPSSTDEPLSKKRRIATPCFIGPHFNEYWKDGQKFTLRYTRRFHPNPVFLAEAMCQNTGELLKVVVKFSETYGKCGHELLAKAKPKALAPRLYYCEKEESVNNRWIIIMEHIEGELLLDTSITRSHDEDIKAALNLLHANQMVFGDLRKGNIVCSPVGAKLLDFDWCGNEGEVFYPIDINLNREWNINWAPGVGRGTRIKKEHDLHMFEMLKK